MGESKREMVTRRTARRGAENWKNFIFRDRFSAIGIPTARNRVYYVPKTVSPFDSARPNRTPDSRPPICQIQLWQRKRKRKRK